MDYFLTPVFSEQIHSSSKMFAGTLRNNIDELFRGEIGISYGDEYSNMSIPDWKRVLASIDVGDDKVALCIRNSVIESAWRAESAAAFGGLIAIIAFVQHQQNVARHEFEEDNTDMAFLKKSARLKKSEYFSLMRSILKDNLASSILVDAIELIGFSGQIFVNDKNHKSTYLELRKGYNFPLSYVPEFGSALRSDAWSAKGVSTIVIDGIIETVGEMHHILDWCCTTKQPTVIFARGYSEEVIATITVNNARSTLKLAPVRVPFDLSGINALNDIAVVCGTDVVSSLKGELISSIDLDSLSSVDSISINNRSLRIENRKTHNAVKYHTRELTNQRTQFELQDAINLIDARLLCLSSSSVHINLGPELASRRGSIADKVESGLRLLKDICSFGVLNTEVMIGSPNSNARHVGEFLCKHGYHYFSSRSIHAGLTFGIKTSELLTKSSVFLVEQN